MTDSDQAKAVCRYLDAGAQQVSLRVQMRLAAARNRALEALPSVSTAAPPVAASGQASVLASAPPPRERTSGDADPGTRRRSLWWQIGAAAAPALVVIASLLIGEAQHEGKQALELVEVDTELLTDDVPLMAYADHGFGVYLKNTRR